MLKPSTESKKSFDSFVFLVGLNLEKYKSEFLKMLIKKGALKLAPSKEEFFTLKSGRKSPYFVNIGSLTDGESIHALRKAYAGFVSELLENGEMEKFEFIYGPAYKGITLAALLAEGLFEKGYDVRTLYDRKEIKEYGDLGADKVIVGANWFKPGGKIVIVDDVITTGETKLESIDKLKLLGDHKIVGVILAVDRKEKMGDSQNLGEMSSTDLIRKNYKLPVHSILTIEEIFEEVKHHLPHEIREAWIEYYDVYGGVKLK